MLLLSLAQLLITNTQHFNFESNYEPADFAPGSSLDFDNFQKTFEIELGIKLKRRVHHFVI